MLKRQLSNTGIWVSLLGLGTVKFGRNKNVHYPSPFDLPSDYAIETLLAHAQSLGINFLDTAPAYGQSEERLGKLLRGKRHDWVLATKAGEEFVNSKSHYDFSAASIRNSVEHSLKQLKTDYLDIVLAHSNGDDLRIIQQEEVLSTLAELKTAGWIRAFGMSTKTVECGLLAIDNADIVMVTFNPIQQTERDVIRYAQQQKKGVLIKKALASGHLDKIADDDAALRAFDFILREPGVSSIVMGTINPEHLQQNAECVETVCELLRHSLGD